ncbi:MAG: hypothetical protein COB60_05605 [Flavobacteriaceae bacterium]|nr:MAG: hypothetical protein COB60_05605 [Flavobacteriaceae bacterium]
MLRQKKRKEILLDTETIELLQKQANREGRKLKNYMEFILKEKANSFVISENYKNHMDIMLDKQERETLEFTPWKDAKNKIISI